MLVFFGFGVIWLPLSVPQHERREGRGPEALPSHSRLPPLLRVSESSGIALLG